MLKKCPHCKAGKLHPMPEDFPWTSEHLMCYNCFSTYIKEELVMDLWLKIVLGILASGVVVLVGAVVFAYIAMSRWH